MNSNLNYIAYSVRDGNEDKSEQLSRVVDQK